MPFRAARACAGPGCAALVRGKDPRCSICSAKYQARRGTATDRGYGEDWRKLRKAFLREHPLCADCEKAGLMLVEATDVDHIVPHRGDDLLRLDWNNLQPLCHSCHSKKTARSDGGFGNTRYT